jgi:hypothetical protein
MFNLYDDAKQVTSSELFTNTFSEILINSRDKIFINRYIINLILFILDIIN